VDKRRRLRVAARRNLTDVPDDRPASIEIRSADPEAPPLFVPCSDRRNDIGVDITRDQRPERRGVGRRIGGQDAQDRPDGAPGRKTAQRLSIT